MYRYLLLAYFLFSNVQPIESHFLDAEAINPLQERDNPHKNRVYKWGKKPTVMSKDRNWIWIYNDIPTSSIKPPKPDLTYLSNTTQVYVQISSLHDDRCGRTLHSLMTNAEFPERVNIGVVQQNDPTLDNFECDY